MTEELKEKIEEIAKGSPKTEEINSKETMPEYLRLKQENDLMETELQRKEELRQRQQLHGRAEAGSAEVSEEEKAKQEAAEKLKVFGY